MNNGGLHYCTVLILCSWYCRAHSLDFGKVTADVSIEIFVVVMLSLNKRGCVGLSALLGHGILASSDCVGCLLAPSRKKF